MAEFDPRLYGARWAAMYDEWHTGLMDDTGAVSTLAELADGGPLLEFGVGTGRLAVPLAEKGLEVIGVDVSEEMLAEMAKKATTVTPVVGDMTTVRLEREFAVVYIAFNSIFVLPSQQDQVQAFRNAARHLRPGGRFVLETMVSAGAKPGEASSFRVANIETDRLTVTAGMIDPATGFRTGTWVVFEPEGTKIYPISGRSVSHFEMDLMAQLAGLELEHRWADWQRGKFDGTSQLHISVYRKPAAGEES